MSISLSKEKLQHISTTTHESKVVVFATDAEGKIWYTIKQDGFEDSYLNTPEDQRTGWENWQALEFPTQDNDQSVIDKETAELTEQSNTSNFILRSRYRTQDQSAVAPVQVVSALGHVYVFRQSKADATNTSPNTLLVDRFILDGMTNKLVRKLDVRFKRSRQKYKPIGNMQKANGGLANIDTLDYRDANGNEFYEPTTELSLIKNLQNGWFSVVLVPTNEHDNYRWHIFAYNSQIQKVELTTIRASDDELFDVQDYTVLEAKPEAKNDLVPRSIPGIIRRTLDLGGVQVINGFSATKYDLQKEQQTQQGMQLLRDATKVMLAIPAKQGTGTNVSENIAVLNFSIAADGTLSQIDETPDSSNVLRSNSRQLLLPLNTLDKIKGIGTTNPPPQGTITTVTRGEEDTVQIASSQASTLNSGDVIQITKTQNYDGHYVARNINGTSFEIEASYVTGDIGSWEVVPKEEIGLIFDGAITAFERVTNNRLKITAANHGLSDGDEVQIINTTDYNRTVPIEKIDNQHFLIDGIRWQPGEAVNLKLESSKRRGIMFDGSEQQYIAIPALELTPPSTRFAFGYTISAWVYVSATPGSGEKIIVGEKNQRFQLSVNSGTVCLKVNFSSGYQQVSDSATIPLNQWVHYAGIIASSGTSNRTTLTLCKNGQQVGTAREVTALPSVPENWRPELVIGKSLAGKIADVLIWDKARTAKEIKDSMYLQLTGEEVDLVGYWRLGAITEGQTRTVVDFSANGNDGTVYGDAFVSAVSLNRNLGNGTTPVVKYSNDELVAVSARATYVESFEFKTNPNINPNNVDNQNGKLFSFSYWGKKSRSAEQKITFSGDSSDFVSLGNNWYKASCRFTVPDEVAMMRTFELANVKGTWSTLEIRKHRVQLVSESITEVKYTDSVSLSTLAARYAQLPGQLNTLEQKEQKQAGLLKEKSQLEKDIAALNNLPLLQQQVAALQTEVTSLQQQEQTLKTKYDQEVANPLNYECYFSIQVGSSWKGVHVYEQSNNDDTVLCRHRGTGNLFRFQRQEDGDLAYLEVKVESSWKGVHVYHQSNDDARALCRHSGTGNLCQIQKQGNYYYFSVQVGSSWKGVHVYQQSDSDNATVIRFSGTGNLFSINQTNQRANNKIETAQTQWDNKKTELIPKQNELNRLQTLVNASASQKSILETRLQQVKNELTQVQSELNTANNTVITTVSTTQQTAQALPTIYTVNSGSQTGLVTKGALLGFASPASRVSAIETCEGNVQLSYFDNQGRMRLTNYDATSDSSNTTFEQWLPDELPVGLNFANSNDKIQLTNPIYLSNSWTVESWFYYQTSTLGQRTLVGSTTGNSPVVVKDNSKLGILVNGFFYDSGYNLEQLTPGWHHLAAVGKGEDQQATTTFYIDGKKVGEVKSLTALEFDGVDDYIEVAAHTNPTTAITVALWAKSNTENWNEYAFLASKRNAYILHPTKDSKQISFQIYASSSWRSLEYTPSDITKWHHYAGTFDGKTMNLYIDGVQVATSNVFTTTTAINSDSGSLYIGKDDDGNRYFNGQITEVSVWSQVLTQSQIQTNMGKVLQGNESGLVGYWRFSASTAQDLSSSPKNGTFRGQPKAVTLLAKNTGTIEVIGNSTAGSQQFGKLAEWRAWNIALSNEEIAINSKTRLSGNEPGLAAYYPMNEATGTIVRDLTGSGNDGTVSGATWWGCSAPIGNLGHKVMKFDGVDDYIQLPAKSIDFSQGFTVEAWVYYNSFKSYSRIIDFSSGSPQDNIIFTNAETTGKLALHVYRGTTNQSIEIADVLEIGKWVHLAATIDSSGNGKLFKNGQEIKNGSVNLPQTINRTQNYIGKSNWSSDPYFDGKLAEVRIWNKARTEAQIRADMNQSLTGKESGLVAYLPLKEIRPEGSALKVLDLTSNNNHGTVNGAIIQDDNTLPIGSNALVSAEYSTVTIDPTTKAKTVLMRRFFASPSLNSAELLPDKRVEQLELQWIGNAQFAPTLLGYIEGAPPVPSENLTVEENYNGATSVELTMSEDVEYSWNRSQDSGLGLSTKIFAGGETEASAGLFVQSKIATMRLGFSGNLDFSYNFQNQTNIATSSSLSMTDRLELRGTQEPDIKFPHLGKRFIPKNIGYALVVSSLADVFITRLQRTKKMIGYQVQPVDGIPPDVNTITFLINPVYTMSGSLDGMTGSSATSDRFFRHVPEMRAQYGSLYPASYYRLQEAYDLKKQIENEDKRRESYFAHFNARLLDEASLERETNKGPAPTEISVNREEDKADPNMSEEQKKKAEEDKAKQAQADAEANLGQQSKAVSKKQDEIDSKIADQEKRTQAAECFASWQKKMENIQIRAGKRNIVNTYVWDADGGLRTEAQSFASTVEHTIGGSFALNAGLGLDSKFGAVGAKVELTAQATINMTQTMSKTQAISKGFELNVDLSAVEGIGITDYNDYPILPGEKVDRYRFMSFYLEGSTKNFNDFFSYVVDPEWLASNDEEARALRQAKGKANKVWRVLHRVTYVERPALMGFGRDVRQVDNGNL